MKWIAIAALVFPAVVSVAAPSPTSASSPASTPTSTISPPIAPGRPVSSGQPRRPTSRAPVTRPSPDELLSQAYDAMFAEDFGKARAPIESLAHETPLHDRSRPIVLNRAILDLVQKQYVMRGVRELSFYLSKHPASDEEASNILGSALDLAGKNERLLNGAIYKEAFGEFARREFALERRRPGWKRWGAKWVTEEEFKAIQRRRDEADALIAEQWERVILATHTADTLRKQFDEAAKRSRGFTFHQHGARGGGNASGRYIQNCPLCEAQLEATMSMNDLQADALAANNELARERMEFEKLKKLIVKPQWPARYPPIRPDALQPPPITTPTPAVASSAPSFPAAPETTALPASPSSGNAPGR